MAALCECGGSSPSVDKTPVLFAERFNHDDQTTSGGRQRLLIGEAVCLPLGIACRYNTAVVQRKVRRVHLLACKLFWRRILQRKTRCTTRAGFWVRHRIDIGGAKLESKG